MLVANVNDPLSFAAPSSAPRNFRGSSTSSTSIKVTWESPSSEDHNGVLNAFSVYYRAVGGGFTDKSMKQKLVAASVTVANLTGLEPNVEYDIKVSASTAVGEGPLSAGLSLRTAESGKKVTVDKIC